MNYRIVSTLGALGCAVTLVIMPVQSYATSPSPQSICTSATEAAMTGLEANLSPANGAEVKAGTSVIFSGPSESPLTFAVASSSALLSSPDIDSGSGSVQPGGSTSGSSTSAFTSTKATATPGTVYWTASFSNADLLGCAEMSPSIQTTRARTLIVLPGSPASPQPLPPPPVAAPSPILALPESSEVSLAGTTITVQGGGTAIVKLGCTGNEDCHGKLTLTTKSAIRTKGKRKLRTATIGVQGFSVSEGETTAVKIDLDATGRALLAAGHGRLAAYLAILEPGPGSARSESVRLVQQKTHGKK